MIRNIIFDFGGVILNIDYYKTIHAFNQLSNNKMTPLYSQGGQKALFDQFDVGQINAATFRKELQNILNVNLSDEAFDQAWNAMLLDLPKSRLDFILSLRQTGYRTFLFSNINEIHYQHVFERCQKDHGISNFDAYFEKQYYSHLFGQRKPNVEAFQEILKQNSLKAEETLFIDDSRQHIEGAIKAGMHVIYLTPAKSLFCVRTVIERLERQASNEVQQMESHLDGLSILFG